MAYRPEPGEQFTVRRKIFKIFGAGFHVYDAQGAVVAYCKQKAFRIREDIRVYRDDSMSTEIFRITTKSIFDFSGTYTLVRPDGSIIGAAQRGGIASTFYKDTWKLFSAEGRAIGVMEEESGFLAVLRRYVELLAVLVPQKFHVRLEGGRQIAGFRTHFNPFVYRLGVTVDPSAAAEHGEFVLGLACLVAAIEGRQDGA